METITSALGKENMWQGEMGRLLALLITLRIWVEPNSTLQN
jgi:hypothetical protein